VPAPLVLVVDDDPAVAQVLLAQLAQIGVEGRHAADGAAALDLLRELPIDCVITDMRMPRLDGIELLEQLKRSWPDIPAIMLTAHGSIALAVEAMKKGAADFILKPFDREEVAFAVRKALAQASRLREAPPSVRPQGFVSRSAVMEDVHRRIARVAAGTATVLIRGESGTGKELVARAIHEQSPRGAGPFVAIHCGALPENLLESELFGYEKGAFTGAAAQKPGRVELAQGGTLFLDEVGDMPAAIQVKLLRLLQERQFERLGGRRTLKVDVRFLAATHRDLDAMTKTGEFREDLFYRLNVIPLWLPPLRERRDDIAPLAAHFCACFARENGRGALALSDDSLAALAAQPWPGNVRQLQNVVERAVLLADGLVITPADLERELDGAPDPGAGVDSLDGRRREAERDALLAALGRARGNRTLAARLLGVSRRTLYYKLKEHGVA
jgi:two-component system, NtrC family, response regulator AtoC